MGGNGARRSEARPAASPRGICTGAVLQPSSVGWYWALGTARERVMRCRGYRPGCAGRVSAEMWPRERAMIAVYSEIVSALLWVLHQIIAT